MDGTRVHNVPKDDYRHFIHQFLDDLPFRRSIKADPSIENFLLERALSHGIEKEKALNLAVQGATAAQSAYPRHHRNVQLLIGLFTLYFMVIDDEGSYFLDHIKNFRRNLLLGVQQTQILQSFSSLLYEFDEHYSLFCADKITSGLINYMGSCAMECDTTMTVNILRSAPEFPRYFRVMSGLTEPYAYFIMTKEIYSPDNIVLFIQAIPEIVDFTDTVNDILSFYKESILSDERNTYVFHRAASEGAPVLDVLRRMGQEAKQLAQNIRLTVSTSPELSMVVDDYITGYIGFHVSQPRYKLFELGIF